MFLVMDQSSPELSTSSVKGRNPFRDIRVRRALYQAIDIETIKSKVMHGFSVPAGLLFPPGVRGYPADLERRLPYDPEGARKLLAEAGYREGFDFTLDCTNNRYINDEAICRALVAMWAQVGNQGRPAVRRRGRQSRPDAAAAVFGRHHRAAAGDCLVGLAACQAGHGDARLPHAGRSGVLRQMRPLLIRRPTGGGYVC